MAERRMFAKTIITSDRFSCLPYSSQLLYFHMLMMADDDGLLGSVRMIMRMTGTSDDDLKVLTDNNFIILFESGVVVITHWRVHNYIRPDRYKPTIYQNEKSRIFLGDNNIYYLGIPNDNQMDTQVSIGKVSIDKDSIVTDGTADTKQQSTIPTADQVKEYCKTEGFSVDADKFIDYYNANGWKVGQNPIKDWKAVLRNWERKEKPSVKATGFSNFTQSKTDFESIRKKSREKLMEKIEQMKEKKT